MPRSASQTFLTSADRLPGTRLLRNWAMAWLTPKSRWALLKIAGVPEELLTQLLFHESAQQLAEALFDLSCRSSYEQCPLRLLAHYLLLLGPSGRLDPQDAAYAQALMRRLQERQQPRGRAAHTRVEAATALQKINEVIARKERGERAVLPQKVSAQFVADSIQYSRMMYSDTPVAECLATTAQMMERHPTAWMLWLFCTVGTFSLDEEG